MKYSASGKITRKIELTGQDIIRMMSQLGTRYTPPDHASVEFDVPRGGDYSGCAVDFKNEARVVVTWVTEANEVEDED